LKANAHIRLFLFLGLLAFSAFCGHAQQADTTAPAKVLDKKAIYGSARKAAIMSACLPGLGQIYNHKVWKVPIIYAALGGLTYGFIQNNKQYNYYRKNLIALNDGDSSTNNTTPLTQHGLVAQKNSYRRYRDLCIIGGVVVYVLNIIDANVDAHLRTFDVSDDLSLRIKPYTNFNMMSGPGNGSIQNGLSFQLTFK